VTLALVATTLGLLLLGKQTVTLSLDGVAETVRTDGETVGQVLEDEGIEIGRHDVVAPSLDTPVRDGSRIAVRFGRPLDVNLDGERTRHWVTATDVSAALQQIGLRIAGAALSTSRGAEISRSGMRLTIATPKRITFVVAGKRPVTKKVAALTVGQALKMQGVKVDRNDQVSPRLGKVLGDRQRINVTKVRIVERKVTDEVIPFTTDVTYDSSMYEGDDKVLREGRNGSRDVTYRLRFENGELVARKVLQVRGLVEAQSKLVRVGTKERVVAYATGSTVWDQLAQCESGGNWAINTGNGYYGGLQFSLSTWQAYGGSGYPHQNSREQQIAIAERVRAATGGYGSWPHCSASLGLPQ
jgi:uncharacterized protein YabE (DUF348 family)